MWTGRSSATPLPAWARPAVGGLLVGGLALVTPQVLAAGHGAMKLDLPVEMTMKVLAFLIAIKLLAALISLGSGFRGGLFFASLFVGALLGKLGGVICHHALHSWNIDQTACVLTGMGVFAVAVVGGPLTMSFLVLETTGDFSVTAPVLAACIVTSLVVRETFGYSFSTWRLAPSRRDHQERRRCGLGALADCGQADAPRPPHHSRRAPPWPSFAAAIPSGSTHMVVVLDEQERYAGLAPTAELFTADLDEKAADTAQGRRIGPRPRPSPSCPNGT